MYVEGMVATLSPEEIAKRLPRCLVSWKGYPGINLLFGFSILDSFVLLFACKFDSTRRFMKAAGLQLFLEELKTTYLD